LWLGEEELERRLYGEATATCSKAEPNCAWIHGERHRPGVTLDLLHHEYLEKHPEGLRYTAFCDRYRDWLGRRGLVMRQVHVAGDKIFVDYSGKKPHLVDPRTGEVNEVELFVAVLGAPSYTYPSAIPLAGDPKRPIYERISRQRFRVVQGSIASPAAIGPTEGDGCAAVTVR